MVEWTEGGALHRASWRSESGAPPPARIRVVDDRITAEEAYGEACQGVSLLWRGDFHNARQLLSAMARRADRRVPGPRAGAVTAERFHRHRQLRAQRARTLAQLLVPLDAHYRVPLRRGPELAEACLEVYGPGTEPSVVALRELLGIVGAFEWRRKGIDIEAVGGKIRPYYGVFAPVRREYVDLVAAASLAPDDVSVRVAFDLGTGTGVLAAVLARRGFGRVIATDLDPRALACARANLESLGLASRVEVVEADLFPPGRADLVVFNPPWLPIRPSSRLEAAIYDPDSRLLSRFLVELPAHLETDGEGWLILSDLAEHLGLRTRDALLAKFDAAGLEVIERRDIRPSHPRVGDARDPLHAARALELTSLWRLRARRE